MLNLSLINEAVFIAVQYQEAEQVYEETVDLLHRATIWYNHTEITDAEILAAVVMTGELPNNKTTINDIERIHEFFFPKSPFEFINVSVEEIKMALKDEMWR